ncbi:MAG: hypothetical protein V7631_406 [Massilia sp.]|jgi:hypothetical protein
MKPTILKTLLLCAGLGCCSAALAAATLVRDVRVFDGETVHERRSVLFDKGVIVDPTSAARRRQAAASSRARGARCCRA